MAHRASFLYPQGGRIHVRSGTGLGHSRHVAGYFGRVLLGVVAMGLLAFAVENAVVAIHRAIPAPSERKLKTLATDAKLKAARHLRGVTS